MQVTSAPGISSHAMPEAPAATAGTATTTPASSEQTDASEGAAAPTSARNQSNRITVSHGGRVLSRTADDGTDAATRAIRDSKYPEEIKKLMIKIRELQAQLREKAAELQDVVGDQKLPPRQREMKTAEIREAVSTISSAIRSTTATLNDALTVMQFSSDDRRTIAVMLSA
ncbi:hypothetical protein [Cupriavidus sp. RAF12]|uniref:hypothetical protein n=1 Tax=Cupriavidus sp. RAF12 TaxID=3233050 RepID=UPI003F923D96